MLFGECVVFISSVARLTREKQSTDLVNWSRQNDALTPVAGTMISSSNIVERPKGESEDVHGGESAHFFPPVIFNQRVRHAQRIQRSKG